MGLFDFFKRGEKPIERFTDDVLGPMVWSPTAEAWRGEHAGVVFLIGYDRSGKPLPNALQYARDVLADPDKLVRSVENAKRAGAVSDYSDYAEEFARLKIEEVGFYERKGVHRMFISLAGGKDYRAWRVEFTETTCEGIGFDS